MRAFGLSYSYAAKGAGPCVTRMSTLLLPVLLQWLPAEPGLEEKGYPPVSHRGGLMLASLRRRLQLLGLLPAPNVVA